MGFEYAEADDKGAVIGKHRLIPGDFRLQLRKAPADPIQDLLGACAMVRVLDSRQIVLKIVHFVISHASFLPVSIRRISQSTRIECEKKDDFKM